MNNLAFLLLLNFFSQANTNVFQLYKDDKYIDIKIKSYNGMSISESCFKNSIPKCDAVDATKKTTQASAPKTDTIGHPAARYCHDVDGANRILIAKDGKQYDYCIFKDESMIDSWNLYYKRFPKK